MPRYAHLVMGPAGSGKSTYCAMMLEHLSALRRSAAVVNLDPAAEHFSYPVAIDVRDLIEVGDVTEDDSLGLGPNGGLIFCMEHLVANPSWLELALGQDEDDYLLIDCPGQVELYTHLPVMRELVGQLQHLGVRVCGVFLLDSHFMMEAFKYVSGVLTALSAMVSLEIPQVNVLSKMDLLSPGARKQIHKVDDYSLVRFMPLDRSEDDSVDAILAQVDSALQYGEDEEPREPRDEDAGNDGDFDNFLQNS